ncbi:MAG: CDP-glycerol glycerophosphotransferase family protein, partial [Saccharopolyspora sp.]|uniref:CDP-glycerol glycerophosphotransferase family protein n=1 Tax=Saccharopolyspora sp. TaxID=33915 RepID=UPI0025FD8EE9
NRFGEQMIENLCKTKYHIILRPHPQSMTSEKELIDRLREKFPESEKLEWNFDNDNFDVLYRSDLLISDYSGVVFDFTLVFDRPTPRAVAELLHDELAVPAADPLDELDHQVERLLADADFAQRQEIAARLDRVAARARSEAGADADIAQAPLEELLDLIDDEFVA